MLNLYVRDYLFLLLLISAVSTFGQKPVDSISIDSIYKTIELDSVVVRSSIRKIDDRGSHLIYNVYQEKVNTAVSSTDLLRKTPMVSVDLNGNVSLKGNSSVKILVNDRDPGGMSYNQILDQIPVGDVMKIEVITSPSSKYDAQGIGGIINIVTRKRMYFKSSGYTNLGIGAKGSHLMGNYSYAFNDTWSMQNSIYGLIGYSKTIMQQSLGEQNLNSSGHSLGQLYGYQFRLSKVTDHEDLNLSLQYIYQDMGLKENVSYNALNPIWSKVNSGYSFYRVGADYSLNLSPKVNMAVSSLLYYLPTNNKITSKTLDSRDGCHIWNNTSSVDWTIKSSRNLEFETGLKYDISYFDQLQGQDILQNGLTTGGYLNLKYSVNPFFGLHGGTRYEYYHIGCTFDRKKNYHDIFYNVGLNYKFTAESTLSIDVNSRINRPTYASLLPEKSYTSMNIVRSGNTAVQPEHSYNFEMGLSSYVGDCFVKLSPYYRYINHSISDIISVDGNQMMQSTFNLDKEINAGFNLWITLNLLQGRFNMNGGFDLVHKKLNADGMSAQGNQYITNLSFTWRVANGFYVYCYGSWSSADIFLQGKQNGYTYSNLSVQKSWLNDNLRVALSMDNPFTSSTTIKRDYDLNGLKYRSRMQYQNRGLRVFLTYKFGKKNMEQDMKVNQNILNNY